jgi:hypothetical protein
VTVIEQSEQVHVLIQTEDEHILESAGLLILPGEDVPTGPPGPSVDVVVTGSTGAAYNIDVADGSYFMLDLDDNCVLTFTDAPVGRSFAVRLTQVGGFSATWPGSVLWAGGTPPTASAGNGEVDVLVFVSNGPGSWDGFLAGAALA